MPHKGLHSAYKGHPRSEWGAIKERLHAEKAAKLAAEKSAPTEHEKAGAAINAAAPAVEKSPAEQFMQQVHAPKKAPDANFRELSNVSLDVPVAQPALRPRAPVPNLFSGKIQKLVLVGKDGNTQDPVPGYRTHWFVDAANSGTRLNQAKMSGWEFITRDEVALNDGLTGGNTDLGAHVRQIAGVDNGVPFYMYAMKKPLWLEAEHQAEYAQKAIAPIKEALVKGRLPGSKPEDRQYAAGDEVAVMTRSGLPPISIGSKTYR